MNINVRGVDEDLWRRFRAVAVLRQTLMGVLLSQMLADALPTFERRSVDAEDIRRSDGVAA